VVVRKGEEIQGYVYKCTRTDVCVYVHMHQTVYDVCSRVYPHTYTHTHTHTHTYTHTYMHTPSMLLRDMYMKMSHIADSVTRGGFLFMWKYVR